jgi:8-oxo-dGTP diphosphatase
MADRAVGVFVTVDSVIPRLSPSGAGWEVVFIQRKKEPYIGLWALPGGHLTTEDASFS